MNIATFSIAAYDAEEKAWGIAVASKFLAVGAVVPWARAQVGAVATQAYANTTFGPRGLDFMKKGLSAKETLQHLLADDPESQIRQVGLVDTQGNAVNFTGQDCKPWAGGITEAGFTVQGNLLTGPEVLEAMCESFARNSGNLPERLYVALSAGDQAGGDKRGRQSAAILVVKAGGGYGGFNDCWVNYRVDDHPNPVHQLGKLLKLHILHNETSPPEDQAVLHGEQLRQLQAVMARMGLYDGERHGEYDEPTRAALEALVINENIRDRTDIPRGSMDVIALDYILKRFE